MKTLFSDIYNKIMDWFQIDKSENTSECATNRLQVILMHDRTKLDPLIMNKMREELIDVFSKYVVIDKEELEIGLKNEGDAVALMLNIPIVRAKTEEELEEIRKKLQEEEKVSEDEEDEDDSEEDSDDESEEDEEIKEETEDEDDDNEEEENDEEASEDEEPDAIDNDKEDQETDDEEDSNESEEETEVVEDEDKKEE